MALSDYANQELYLIRFLAGQGYKNGPVIVYQDNLSCMPVVEGAYSRTRHIDIRYIWLKERDARGEEVIRPMGTADM